MQCIRPIIYNQPERIHFSTLSVCSLRRLHIHLCQRRVVWPRLASLRASFLSKGGHLSGKTEFAWAKCAHKHITTDKKKGLKSSRYPYWISSSYVMCSQAVTWQKWKHYLVKCYQVGRGKSVFVCVADFQNGMSNLFGPVTTFNPPGFESVSISTIISAYFALVWQKKTKIKSRARAKRNERSRQHAWHANSSLFDTSETTVRTRLSTTNNHSDNIQNAVCFHKNVFALNGCK